MHDKSYLGTYFIQKFIEHFVKMTEINISTIMPLRIFWSLPLLICTAIWEQEVAIPDFGYPNLGSPKICFGLRPWN